MKIRRRPVQQQEDPNTALINKLSELTADGPCSFGDARRQNQIEPTKIVRAAIRNPHRFTVLDIGGRPHLRKASPPPLTATEIRILNLLGQSHFGGMSIGRLRASNVSRVQSEAFALKFPHWARLIWKPIGGKNRQFLALVGTIPQESPVPVSTIAPQPVEIAAKVMIAESVPVVPTEAPIDLELVKGKDELVGLLTCRHGSRNSDFLASFGFPMERVRRIDRAFPDLLAIEESAPGQYIEARVALRQKVEEAPEPVAGTRSFPEPEPIHVVPRKVWDDIHIKVGRRRPRGQQVNAQSVIHRQRFPVVQLPPA